MTKLDPKQAAQDIPESAEIMENPENASHSDPFDINAIPNMLFQGLMYHVLNDDSLSPPKVQYHDLHSITVFLQETPFTDQDRHSPKYQRILSDLSAIENTETLRW